MRIYSILIILILCYSCKSTKEVEKYDVGFELLSEGLELKKKEKKKIYNSLTKRISKQTTENGKGLTTMERDSIFDIVMKKYLSKEKYEIYQDKERLSKVVSEKAMEKVPKTDESQYKSLKDGMKKKVEYHMKYYHPKIKELRKKFEKEIDTADKIDIQNLREHYEEKLKEKEEKLKKLYEQLDSQDNLNRKEALDLLIIQYRYFISKEHLNHLMISDEYFKNIGTRLFEKYATNYDPYRIEAYKIWKEYRENVLKSEVKQVPKEKQKKRLDLSFLLIELD